MLKKDFLSSEFTILLSRGKLSHSPPESFFTLYFVLLLKNMDKAFVNYLLHVFQELFESSQLEDAGQNKILRRFVNYFSKACALHELD